MDLNATQAAKDIGCENLAKPNIRACVDEALAERSKRTGINADRVLMELARLGFVNAVDVININKATVKENASRDDTAAIASVKVKTIPTEDGGEITERKIKLYDKTKNLELLGKHLGLFTDKIDITVEKSEKLADIIAQLGGEGLEE